MWTLTPVEVLEPDLKSRNWTSTATSSVTLVARSATRVAEDRAVEVQLRDSSPVELKSTSNSISRTTDCEPRQPCSVWLPGASHQPVERRGLGKEKRRGDLRQDSPPPSIATLSPKRVAPLNRHTNISSNRPRTTQQGSRFLHSEPPRETTPPLRRFFSRRCSA